MNRNYSISVAMATFNGEKYIKEQLSSILIQLNDIDEVVISDDGSTDNTLKIIREFNDKRINLISGPKKGVKKNFENAINNCKGRYIFLSDQDDIWSPIKINVVLNIFNNKSIILVVHDAQVFDSKTNNIIINSFFEFRNSGNGILKNILKNSYIGCCMAFDSDLKDFILPIPDNIEMHDQWIGIIGEMKGKVSFINNQLISYRRHSNNVSSLKHHSISKMILNRFILVKNILIRRKYDKHHCNNNYL